MSATTRWAAPDGRGPPRQLGLLIGRNLQRQQKQQEREMNDKRRKPEITGGLEATLIQEMCFQMCCH